MGDRFEAPSRLTGLGGGQLNAEQEIRTSDPAPYDGAESRGHEN